MISASLRGFLAVQNFTLTIQLQNQGFLLTNCLCDRAVRAAVFRLVLPWRLRDIRLNTFLSLICRSYSTPTSNPDRTRLPPMPTKVPWTCHPGKCRANSHASASVKTCIDRITLEFEAPKYPREARKFVKQTLIVCQESQDSAGGFYGFWCSIPWIETCMLTVNQAGWALLPHW